MNAELTKEEKSAISSFRRLAKRWPSTLHVLVVDGDITVCKFGVPSFDISERVDLHVTETSFLNDMHDDMNNGLDM